jgi:eukaryotic-like serine/threonine-protein kinase
MTNPFGHNPFESNPFQSGPVGMPGPPQPPMQAPTRPRDEANVLATLSVVFAFVFAPVGAILGHLGLSQIRHTGEKGRDRALVGVTLSYVFITVAVVALIVGATLADDSPTRVATPTSTTAPAATTSATPPPPPTVAPADLEGLLPSLDDAKNITGDHDLTVKQTYRQPTRDPNDGSIDRPECWSVFDEGAPDGYNVPAIAGFISIEYLDVHTATNTWQAEQGVAAFHDAAAAQAQLASLQSQWRQCGGSTLTVTMSGYSFKTAMSVPADAGNGITTIDLNTLGLPLPVARAIAAKNNVVVDVLTSSSGADIDRVREVALTITNSILAKIPG